MNNKIKLLKIAVQEKNIAAIVYLVIKYSPLRYVLKFSQFYIVCCKEFKGQKLIRPLPLEYAIKIRDYSEEYLQKIQTDLPHEIDSMRYRLKKHKKSFNVITIEHAGTVVAVVFVGFDKKLYSPSGYVHDFKEESLIGLYGEYIHPAYRMKGLHIHLQKFAFDYCIKHGKNGLFGEIHFMNKNSLNSHRKLGFEVLKKMTLIKVACFKFII